MRGLWSRLVGWFVLGVLCARLGTAQGTREGQDRIWVVPAVQPSAWQPFPIEVRTGSFVNLTNQSVTWQSTVSAAAADGTKEQDLPPTSEIPVDRVAAWELSAPNASAVKAIEFETAQQWRDAGRQWLIAATEEQNAKRWWLMARAWEPLMRVGEYNAVLEVIKQHSLVERVPILAAELPIDWHEKANQPQKLDQALSRLSSPSAAVRLVACSWLIGTEHAAKAEAELRKLATENGSPLMKSLAQIVAWRLGTEGTEASRFRDRFLQIKKLPVAVQAGPLILLGAEADRAFEAGQRADRSLAERAVEHYLEGATLYSVAEVDRRWAILRAAELCQRLGREADAVNLRQRLGL